MKTLIRELIMQSIEAKQTILNSEECLLCIGEAAQACKTALGNGKKILLAGNGGSAADAQHVAAELVGHFEKERAGLAAIAITTDTSALTAIGNDYGFERVFSRQIESLGNSGDVFIGISTSGNSSNIVNAVTLAKEKGLKTIALCGAAGKLKEICDISINVPSTRTATIQECHIMIGHILCSLVDA